MWQSVCWGVGLTPVIGKKCVQFRLEITYENTVRIGPALRLYGMYLKAGSLVHAFVTYLTRWEERLQVSVLRRENPILLKEHPVCLCCCCHWDIHPARWNLGGNTGRGGLAQGYPVPFWWYSISLHQETSCKRKIATLEPVCVYGCGECVQAPQSFAF